MAHGLKIHRKRASHQLWLIAWVMLGIIATTSLWFGYRYFTTGRLPLDVTVRALEANPGIDETTVTQAQVDSYSVAKDLPRYISIPKLGVGNTRVYAAGVDANNQLEFSRNISDAAWYKKSAKPGQGYGAALINAHGGGITHDGVFVKLNALRKGDEIIIERGDGEKYRYRVVENQSMPIEEVNKTGMRMMMESAEQGVEGLNLVAPDGKWVPRIKQFDRRSMLRAVRVDD